MEELKFESLKDNVSQTAEEIGQELDKMIENVTNPVDENVTKGK